PASRRKRYPLPRTAPGDLHEHHCDDCRDQQQKEHHRADRGHCRAASRSTSRASSAVSTTRTRSTSPMPITPGGCTVEVSQSSNPCQSSRPTGTTGNVSILWLCIRHSASHSSSNVPKPPGMTTKPLEYFTNMVLRSKKYRKSILRSTYLFRPCS